MTVLDWNDLQWWCATTSEYPIQFLPTWWSPRHDRRLLWAIVKFGWHNWQDMLSQQIKPLNRPLPDGANDASAGADVTVLPMSATTFKYIEHRCQMLASKVDARLTHQSVFSGAISVKRDEKGRFTGFALAEPRHSFSQAELAEERVIAPQLPLTACPDPDTARLVDEILTTQRLTMQQYLQQVSDAAQLVPTSSDTNTRFTKIAPAPTSISIPPPPVIAIPTAVIPVQGQLPIPASAATPTPTIPAATPASTPVAPAVAAAVEPTAESAAAVVPEDSVSATFAATPTSESTATNP